MLANFNRCLNFILRILLHFFFFVIIHIRRIELCVLKLI